MKKLIKITAALTLFCLGFFIFPLTALAVETDIVISEIAAYENSDYEWLEIFNKGAEPVDLAGWKFYEDQTNHGLSAFLGDLIIEPGEYAIIADVAANFKNEYPDFNETILDSSWTTLNENGEELALKNKNGEIIETFTYLPCPDTSLQRIDLNLNDYTENNWQTHGTSNSAGRANEFSSDTPPDEQEPPTEEDENIEPPDDPPQEINEILPKSILINEFVSDPASGENEWIELYNKNDFEVDLEGWLIIDGSETETILTKSIGANSSNPFFIIESPKGQLNNSGDAIILQNNQGQIIDTVYYGNWTAPAGINKAPVAQDPNATARQTDGLDTNNQAADFAVTQTPTKGLANLISSLVDSSPQETDNAPNELDPTKQYQVDLAEVIFINEILPNPLGSDLDNEFIEIKNSSPFAFDLTNWQIKTNKQSYKISQQDFASTQIAGQGFFIIDRKISHLVLANAKDTLKLISPENKTVQTIKYDENPDLTLNASYALNSENIWAWTTTLTKNRPNIITPINHAPIIEAVCPKEAQINEIITCDSSDSYDLENDDLTFTWQIEDQIYSNAVLQYQFAQAGTYTLNLKISDGFLTNKLSKKIKITNPEGFTIASTKQKTATAAGKSSSKKTSSTQKSSAAKNNELITIGLKNAKDLASGQKIKTQGVVSVLPNTFGKTIMYVAGSGIQLYMSKANWPDLKIGDLLEITGTIGESQGNKRIKLASAQDIKVLEQVDPPQPREIKIEEINDSIIDYLIKISGQLLEKSSSKFYLQDDTGEAEIYISTLTKIKKTNYLEGDNLSITGIVRKYNNVFQVLPRFEEDIVKNISAEQQETLTLPATKQSSDILKYLIATAVILCVGLIIFWKFKISPKDEGRSTKK